MNTHSTASTPQGPVQEAALCPTTLVSRVFEPMPLRHFGEVGCVAFGFGDGLEVGPSRLASRPKLWFREAACGET